MIDWALPLETGEMFAPVAEPAALLHPLDPLALLRVRLAKYDETITELVAVADALVVDSDATAQEATAQAGKAKGLIKDIDKARVAAVDPLNRVVKAINGLAAVYKDRLDPIANALARKIQTFTYRQEQDRRETEAAARKAAAELQARLDEEARAKNIQPVKLPDPVVPPAPVARRTETATSYQHTEWRWEITDQSQLPHEYLAVDERAVNQAVRNGIRIIPGVRIFEFTETRFRTR